MHTPVAPEDFSIKLHFYKTIQHIKVKGFVKSNLKFRGRLKREVNKVKMLKKRSIQIWIRTMKQAQVKPRPLPRKGVQQGLRRQQITWRCWGL